MANMGKLGQFIWLSAWCKLVALIAATMLGGCDLYLDHDCIPDAGVELDAGTDTPSSDALTPDAEVLEACADVCAGEEYTEWHGADGGCTYVICRPSYRHCACPAPLPTCVSMGCDGTQNVPLVCPEEGGPCFCAAPNGPDGWCTP